jgi:hypothetical protein
MPYRILLVLLCAGVWLCADAQQASPELETRRPDFAKDYMAKQFGPIFKLDPAFPTAATGDFDGDGKEDLVMVGISKDPLGESNNRNYKVVDPSNSYFGFGDPKITTRFSSFGDDSHRCILVAHDWRAEKPKAKFVIVNLPFQKMSLGQTPYKKKSVTGIFVEEVGGMNAVVFFDGKKYRWEPTEFTRDPNVPDAAQ